MKNIKQIWTLYYIIGVFLLLDEISTYIGLSIGANEANPIYYLFPFATFTIKCVVMGGLYYIISQLIKQNKYLRVVVIGEMLLLLMYILVFINNSLIIYSLL